MTTYHEFPQADIEQLVETARAHYAEKNLDAAPSSEMMFEATPMILGETCIEVTVENGKICLKIPIVDKKVCFPIPSSIPNGTAAKACIKICTTLGFPTGACVTITALGIQVVHQCFGKC